MKRLTTVLLMASSVFLVGCSEYKPDIGWNVDCPQVNECVVSPGTNTYPA